MSIKNTIHSLLLIFAVAISLSNRTGRANMTGRGSTTAPGESGQYCGSFGCHFSNVFNAQLKLEILDDTNEPISTYIPENEYTARLSYSHNGFAAGYGFQMVALSAINDQPINNWSDLSEQMREVQIEDRIYIEQRTILTNDTLTLQWTAPEQGTGIIGFYAAGNVVNGNGSSSGDSGDTTRVFLREEIMSSNQNSQLSKINIYPNPINFHFKITNNDLLKNIKLIDCTGKTIMQQNNPQHTINLSEKLNGIHFLIMRDKWNNQRIKKVIFNNI